MTNPANPQLSASAHEDSLSHSGTGTIFDDTVQLAATLCGAPVGLIATHHSGRTSFQAIYQATAEGRFELAESESPFWMFVSQQSEPLILPDLGKDARFHDDPLVKGAHQIRFYAGVPLHNSSGETAGALIVLDMVARTLHPSRLSGLLLLAHQLESQLQLHEERDHLVAVLAEKQRMENELRSSSALFRVFMDNSPLVSYMKDRAGRMIYYNRLFAERFAIDQEIWLGKDDFELWPNEFAAAYRAT
ncbi:MAG: PAS domain-containing protein, partial [Acidobacteria bacterium]|nr:PAS domain-containing protein [Acidobacteriota bacterium]